MTSPEQLVEAGNLKGALIALEALVREKPANASHRFFLFQLLSVLEQWDRALTQLKVAAGLGADYAVVAAVYEPAIHCEMLRADVLAGRKSPLVLGDPPEWLANVVLANAKFAAGENEAGCELRRMALRSARVLPGSLNGEPFEFLMDADARIGPIIEVVLEGRYFWVPVHQIARVEIQPPSDFHDLVWARAQFTWANQGVASGLIPVRYSALPNPVDVQNGEQEDSQLLLARKTDWSTRGPGVFIGRGQRHLGTNRGLTSLYETREIVFTHPGATESAASVSAAEIIRG